MNDGGTEQGQSKFEGWAMVEIMGHQKEIGYVTTEYFGAACMFRVDTPDIPEQETVLKRPSYATIDGKYRQWPAGTKVRFSSLPGRTRLVSVAAVFSINPCTEEAARVSIVDMVPRTMALVDIPKDVPQIEPGSSEQDVSELNHHQFDEYGDDPPEEIE